MELQGPHQNTPPHDLELSAHALAKRLPALLMEAKRVAQTVAHGIHGRRRSGPGETFWQFRHHETGDSAQGIDWRRSASSDHLFVREREWEAAHTVFIWPDLSPSMAFCSALAPEPKCDRALVLALAVSELLIAGGERVGLLGDGPASANRGTPQKMALSLVQQRRADAPSDSMPPRARLSRFSECVLFSDFLDPPETLAACLEHIAAQGVRGHLVQILDPAEETLPYTGRVEFLAMEGDSRMLAPRAEDLRQAYAERLARQKDAIAALTRRYEWSYLLHHTDRPAGEALFALYARLSGLADSYRAAPGPARASRSDETSASPAEDAPGGRATP
ncbi:MAG: DUF58 domain-containing protein [Alphaproteobacteria bacterium]